MAPFKQTGPFSREFARGVEAMPGRLFGALGKIGAYLGSERAAQDYTNLLRGNIGRPAAAREMMGPPTPSYYGPGGAPTPIVRGTRDGVTPDRTQSDQYRAALSQYAQTPEGQFQRYFQSPEMDQYFGAASRGKGAPENLAAMQSLAAQTKAPADTSLSTYYRAQSAAGRGNMPEIQKSLGYEKGSALAEWAQANPMLAQRLYAKQQAQLESAPSAAPEGAAEFGARAQSEGGYAGTFREQPGLFQAVANPVVPTEDRGGSGLTQGERVDAGRGAPLLRAWQASKTTGSGMPNFPTTGQYPGSF
jgi:hypothetical protein